MTGGEILLECLKAQGVHAIFGMPGTQNLALYDAFHRSGQGIQHLLIRNEQAATMMAGGFARATGEAGVALTVPGPGASNAATGIADAYTDCQPVLLITGGVERTMQHRDRSKMFHGLEQASFFRPIVRYYGCPQSATQIPQSVRAAFDAMLSGRPGPAVLEIPPDVAAEEGGTPCIPEHVTLSRLHRTAARGELERAAAYLCDCKRPVILAGGDVIASNACTELRHLAERLGAPVLHTRLGKGAIPTDYPLNLGNSRHKRAKALLHEADLLLTAGVRFTQIDTANWRMTIPPCLIQLDHDPAEIGREFPVSVGVVGDLATTMTSLIGKIGDAPRHGWGDRLTKIQSDFKRPPGPVLAEIREALDHNGILVCDVTALSYRAFDEYPIYGPRDFCYPCHYVTMGYGLPAALGAKVACPNRPVVALCGDGGVLMSIGELATAAQYNIAVVIVVVADGALMAIKASQLKHYGGRLIDTELPNPDFVAMARSFGVAGYRANDLNHFKSLLAEALALGKPVLIEVPMAHRADEIMQQIPWLSGE